MSINKQVKLTHILLCATNSLPQMCC